MSTNQDIVLDVCVLLGRLAGNRDALLQVQSRLTVLMQACCFGGKGTRVTPIPPSSLTISSSNNNGDKKEEKKVIPSTSSNNNNNNNKEKRTESTPSSSSSSSNGKKKRKPSKEPAPKKAKKTKEDKKEEKKEKKKVEIETDSPRKIYGDLKVVNTLDPISVKQAWVEFRLFLGKPQATWTNRELIAEVAPVIGDVLRNYPLPKGAPIFDALNQKAEAIPDSKKEKFRLSNIPDTCDSIEDIIPGYDDLIEGKQKDRKTKYFLLLAMECYCFIPTIKNNPEHEDSPWAKKTHLPEDQLKWFESSGFAEQAPLRALTREEKKTLSYRRIPLGKFYIKQMMKHVLALDRIAEADKKKGGEKERRKERDS
jgi:hypothetical protein